MSKRFYFQKGPIYQIFFLMVHDPSKNSLPAPRSWRYFSKPSFSSFMVLAFRFKFMTHFKLVSMDGLRFFISYRYTAVPEALVKKDFPFPKCLLCLVKKSHLTLYIWAYLMDASFVYLFANTTLSWLLWLYRKSWCQVGLSPPTLFFLKTFGSSKSSGFQICFKISWPISIKSLLRFWLVLNL